MFAFVFLASPALKNIWGTGGEAELSAKEGDSLSLKCETASTMDTKVTWYKDDEPLSVQLYPSKTTLDIKKMSVGDFGVYKCKVENPLGVKARKIKVINGENERKRVLI